MAVRRRTSDPNSNPEVADAAAQRVECFSRLGLSAEDAAAPADRCIDVYVEAISSDDAEPEPENDVFLSKTNILYSMLMQAKTDLSYLDHLI